MARPTKKGIEYFPFDTDFFEDDKIQFVGARFGLKGENIAIRLLCKIYNEGFYYRFGEDESLLFAKRVGDGCLHSFVNDVVFELVKRGFFDRSIFDRFGILTSAGIQKRFLQATQERKVIEIIEDYWLLEIPKSSRFIVIRSNNEINLTNNDENRPESTQSKVKESKVKENKEIEIDFSFVDESFKKSFFDWLDYKKTRKEPYKSQQTIEACYRKLIRLSRGDPNVAELIIEESLASNWSGFFELKYNSQNGQSISGKSQSDRESTERKDYINRKATEAIAELRDRASQ